MLGVGGRGFVILGWVSDVYCGHKNFRTSGVRVYVGARIGGSLRNFAVV